MLTHIVMWKLLDHADGHTKAENIERLIRGYDELKGVIPQIKNAKMFKNIAPGDMNDLILISTFEDEAALNEYQNHPKHLEYSAFCKKVRQSRAAIDFKD